MEIGPGDEVIVPTKSFVASALAMVRAGARPVLVDVDPDTYLIDAEWVEASITRPKAVVPVHLYGQIASLEELRDLLEGSGIAIDEDAAQSHGSTWHGKAL